MSAEHQERLARLVLSQVFEPGDLRIPRLVEEVGPVHFLEELRSERAAADIVTDSGTRLGRIEPERDLERAARRGIRWVVPGDEEWPVQVDALADAPPVQHLGGRPLGLWVRGSGRLDRLRPAVAVVGSRTATTYGADLAAHIGAVLAAHGHTVVSGAAFGIDQAAHRGALAAGGVSVAVMAHGLDRTYPAAHGPLVDALAERGVVVSELAPGTAPQRVRFLARNRLIAALTDATVVVEAAVRSGALNTASWTDALGHPVLAVPGPVNSAQSQGAHELIRTRGALLVTSGEEVLEAVAPVGSHLLTDRRAPERPRDALPTRLQRILDAVPVAESADTAAIARTCGIGIVQTGTGLRSLEERGFVAFAAGGWRLTRAALTDVLPLSGPAS